MSDAYLDNQVIKRNNLFIRTNATVSRINIEHGIAKGITVGGKSILANKEVLVSAGTFNSPRLLMLSGIGDTSELSKLHIDLVHHNDQVGKNLQDHPFVCMTHHLKDPISLDALNKFPKNLQALLSWAANRDNDLDKCAEMTGYFKSP